MEGSFHAENQHDSSGSSDTIPTCEELTDGQTHDNSKMNKYRASIASRGKKNPHLSKLHEIAKSECYPRLLCWQLLQVHWSKEMR